MHKNYIICNIIILYISIIYTSIYLTYCGPAELIFSVVFLMNSKICPKLIDLSYIIWGWCFSSLTQLIYS